MTPLNKERAARVCEVLLADGWHNIVIGSFTTEHGMFEFQERVMVYSTIVGSLNNLIAVRLTEEQK